MVSISSKNVDVTVRNAIAREARDGIFVETEDQSARVLFLRDGHVAVEIVPPVIPEPLQSPPTSGELPNDEILPSPVSTTVAASGDVETASREPSGTPQAGERQERQPVTRFTGRLGDDPHYDQTHDGKLRVNFPVAENKEGEAIWHKVYSTGERAEAVRQAALTKGDRVRVTGFAQQREIQKRRKDGTTDQVTEERIYALSVKKDAPTETAPAREPRNE